MQFSRPLVLVAGAAIAGIALIGVGAGATFTDSTTSSQKITAGTMNVVVSAAGATQGSTDCSSPDANCTALTLPDVGPVGSTFETTPIRVNITNKGNIPAYYYSIKITAPADGDLSAASTALKHEMNICIMAWDPSWSAAQSQGTLGWVEGNGPLTTAVGLNPTVRENPVKLNPGASLPYWVSFYAGQDSTYCGNVSSDGPHTAGLWGSYSTPASLNDDAQGGSVTPTLTFNFTGEPIQP
jgi:predicted ribosomally synthesized peptide with SipW-like signal peptide